MKPLFSLDNFYNWHFCICDKERTFYHARLIFDSIFKKHSCLVSLIIRNGWVLPIEGKLHFPFSNDL
jgi:hypothetical protein